MTKPMKIVALYNEKGGVGSTSLAAHLCWLARENGIRVAGISFDPTTELRGWIEPLGISWFDGLRHQEPDDGAELLVADIHGQARDILGQVFPLDDCPWPAVVNGLDEFVQKG